MDRDRKETIREKKRRRKKRKIIWNMILIFLLIVAVSGLIVWKVFTVETVVVEGNEHYSVDQIQKFVLSDEHSWNSLYVFMKYRFFEVDEVPFVDNIEISLQNPHTIKATVYEKGMIGYLYIPAIDQNAYFDTDGFVVETSKQVIEGIPRIEGLDCDKVVLYEKLPIKNEKILKSLLSATRLLQKSEIVPAQILFNEKGEISLDYGEIQVILGNSDNLTQKILRVSYVLPQLSGKKGVLHVENWSENTTNIIFDEAK